MKLAFARAFLLCCFVASAVAGTASDGYAEQVRKDVILMTKSVERGESEKIIERTHPSLMKLVGGKEAFEKMTRTAMEQLQAMDIKYISLDVGTPSRLYPAGEEEVCFVPRVTVLEIEGQRMKSTSFLIAVRRVNGTEWKYLDGAGLAKNPQMLYQLLPKLQKGIPLPKNEMQKL